MSRRRSVYVLTTVAAVALAAMAWHRLSLARQAPERARPLPLVQVTTPSQIDMQRVLLLTADILPIQQADLMAKVAGYLDAIYVDRGDRVHAGQTLAIIQQPEIQHQLEQAQANYEFAKLTYDRFQDLQSKDLIAKQELDDARTKLEVARRTLDVQRAYVQYAKIVAPFDGYVTKRYVDPGALIPQATAMVSSTNMVLTIMDLSQVKILVNVPERDISTVHVGDEVSLTVDAYPDQTFGGKVTKFAPALDPGSRTLQVEIDVSNADLALKPGMFARVKLVLERHAQTLAVPSEALLVNELGAFVYTVDRADDNVATVRRVAVRTGIEDSGRVEVLVGLGAQDQIIRAGKEQVREGSQARIATDGTGPERTAER